MSSAIAIFTNELRARTRLFLICAALAVVPFLATLLPSARGQARDVIAIVGGFLAVCIGLGVALTLGNSVLTRDLAERRMSFWFAKPVRPAALWLGKATASVLTALFCFGLIALPAMFAAGAAWRGYWIGDVSVLALAALAIVFLFFVVHALSTVIRSHSPLLVLDFLFAIVTAGALLMIIWPLILGQAVEVLKLLAIIVGAAALLVLAIAPVWQLQQGRADLRRSHAAFSRFFWPAVAVVLLLAGGYVWWLISPAPQDLTDIVVVHQPARGSRVVVAGTTRGRGDYHATFLIDRATGKYERLASPVWWGMEWSADGRVAAWLQPAGLFSMKRLEIYANGRPTGIVLSASAQFVLSDDGTRVATQEGGTISVYELANSRLLMSAAGFDGRPRASLFFANRDEVRVIETRPVRIANLDLRARRISRSTPRDLDTPWQAVAASADGSRLMLMKVNLILDGRTGATLATIPPQAFTPGTMLADGRVAGIVYENGPRVRVFAQDGRMLHDIAMPGERQVYIAGETEGGKLLLATLRAKMYVVDLATGAVVQRLAGVHGGWMTWSADPRLKRFATDQDLVGVGRGRKLVQWSPRAGGTVRPLL
ncbi:MAG TPA: hypothetical protein VND45_11180 [Thermoanaerobaculia bacterium]|jgi:hypothetical protein|nr:hypothetical protein [Thermoanaerobaculia bacterium]